MDSKSEFPGEKHGASDEKKPPLLNSCRLTLVILSFACVFHLFLLRFNMSIGLVCLTTNGTIVQDYFGDEQLFDKKMQGNLLSAFFYGYFSTQIIGGYVADKFGGKLGLLSGIAFMSIGSILLPPSIRLNPWAAFTLRMAQGILSGLAMPSVYNLFSIWSGPDETATLMSIVSAAIPTATAQPEIFPNFLKVILTYYDGGWPLIFYVPGATGLITSILLYWKTYNNPKDHPNISVEELKYLTYNREVKVKGQLNVNWKAVAKSVPLHALWLTHVSFSWCFYLTAINIPILAKDVFEMNITQIGVMSSLPYVGMMCMSFAGKLFDFLKMKDIMSLTNLRKLFNSVAFFVPAFCTFSLHFLRPEDKIGAIFLIVLTVSFLNLSTAGGFLLSHSDLAGPFTGLAFGITNTMAQMPGFITPLIVAYMTPNGTREEWISVYDISAGICIFGGLVYLFFGSSEPQNWSKTSNENHAKQAAG